MFSRGIKNEIKQRTLMNGLTLLLVASFFWPIRLVTLRGYLSIPATIACGYGLSFVPSSSCLITTTFLPACLPWSTMATFPGLYTILEALNSWIVLGQTDSNPPLTIFVLLEGCLKGRTKSMLTNLWYVAFARSLLQAQTSSENPETQISKPIFLLTSDF